MSDQERIFNSLSNIEDALLNPSNVQLPDPALITYYKNLSERRLWADFSVDDMFLEFSRFILRCNIEDYDIDPNERKPIWIYMFNYGGSADIMWMFIDTIQKSRTPIYTVNMGQCGSAAALIFMSGHRRFMMPYATVIIHEGSNAIEGDAVKVIDQAESYKLGIQKMRKFILSSTEIPKAMLSRKHNNDWELNADTCLKYKICDSIIESLDNII